MKAVLHLNDKQSYVVKAEVTCDNRQVKFVPEIHNGKEVMCLSRAEVKRVMEIENCYGEIAILNLRYGGGYLGVAFDSDDRPEISRLTDDLGCEHQRHVAMEQMTDKYNSVSAADVPTTANLLELQRVSKNIEWIVDHSTAPKEMLHLNNAIPLQTTMTLVEYFNQL